MYNGIGLQTARGSGTSGHVQTNKFFIQPRAGGPLHRHEDGAAGMRKPNKEILEHDRRRQVELRLVQLREALEEQGYAEGEIVERVEAARKEAAELKAADDVGPAPRPGEGFMATQSHHAAARKEKKLETLRAALGLDAEVDSDPESGELVPDKDGF